MATEIESTLPSEATPAPSSADPTSTSPSSPSPPPESTSSPAVPASTTSPTADVDAILQISTIKTALEDALTVSPVDNHRLLSSLHDLQSLHDVINTQILAQTQIGLLVNKLTRSSSTSPSDTSASAVRDTAKAIISQWKDKVKAKTTTAPSPPTTSSSLSSSSSTANGASLASSSSVSSSSSSSSSSTSSASPASPRPPSAAKSSSSPPPGLKRKSEEPAKPSPSTSTSSLSSSSSAKSSKSASKPSAPDNKKQKLNPPPPVKQPSPSTSPPAAPSPTTPSSSSSSSSYQLCATGDPTRDKIQKLLFDALGGSAGDWEIELAFRMEKAIFDQYQDTGAQYKTKYRELAMNLKDKDNPDLNDALLCGAWTPEQVVGMSVKDLASASLKAQREAEAKWARDEARSDLGKLNGLTDMFRCGKCKERKCTYYQMQTRSADEPMTVFVRCTVCGNRWKM